MPSPFIGNSALNKKAAAAYTATAAFDFSDDI
jgi:hypothetical protein